MDTDVIVIGAGGGGAVAAKELGEKGIRVVVLEAGPWYGNKNWPLPNAEPGAMASSNYNDLSIELLKKDFTDLENDMNDFVTGKFRWGPADREKPPWLRKILPGGFVWQNSGVGGSTLHYYGNSPRAYPQAVENIWPISYNEMIPYYEKVEETLPVRPAPATAKEDLFLYGCKRAGWSLLESPDVRSPGYRMDPNAILPPNPLINDPDFNFETNNTIGCTLRGHCVNGCHTGPTVDSIAKRSTLVSYIPRALSTNMVEIRPNTFVTKIMTETGADNQLQAMGVTFRNTWTGETGELTAKVIVLAAGGIESPRLWLNSGLPDDPWVGRGLINHWFDNVTGIFDEAAVMDVLGVSDAKPFVGQNSAARFDYPGYGAFLMYGLSPGLFSALAYGTSYKGYSSFRKIEDGLPWDYEGMIVGEQLKEFMRDYKRSLSCLILTDDEVNQNNSVTLDPYMRDENGFLPVVKYQPSQSDSRKRDVLATIAADILRKAGAKTIVRANWPPASFLHIMCTMRMGYVTDTNCEANQVKRLYIADNSVIFNGIGGPNPTLTNQALATRTAEKIAEKYFSS
ncbi:GMC family oxidoreductase N-terminal domain-containing protein [Anaerocolumna xylanovorans]|uniref:Choline dehydrogenase n=1 Tax=Anaerocolumna xylanovorans DSM 12503 TaxID=1121345 RepID=A0A1M7Y1A5_9FIRM|nr:GMC family oxidoreductase N-terminal domain-containing protein [Anaerocolumna xylanovorans]SHO45530.1 Choline dehydrogenase [Anaerocolumna xylanovorans DSM 12503]